MLVTGEAGVGKTRLVDELRGQAGAVTVEARAYPAEGPLAYGLAVAWLRSQPVSARLSRLERPQLIELARLLPELTGHMTPPEAELRHRLFDAVARAVLAAGTPLLLIADDVQWASLQSLGLIQYLMRLSPSARLLVAATARREELDHGHPLTGLITAIQALGRVTEIELARLGREETALLAERVTGAPLDAAGLERLYEDSEGNLLFVVEALQPDAPSAAPTSATAGSAMPPTARWGRPARARRIWRPRGPSSAARTGPRRSRCTTRTPATAEAIRWHERAAEAARVVARPRGCRARWSGRWRCPRISRLALARPGSGSGWPPPTRPTSAGRATWTGYGRRSAVSTADHRSRIACSPGCHSASPLRGDARTRVSGARRQARASPGIDARQGQATFRPGLPWGRA